MELLTQKARRITTNHVAIEPSIVHIPFDKLQHRVQANFTMFNLTNAPLPIWFVAPKDPRFVFEDNLKNAIMKTRCAQSFVLSFMPPQYGIYSSSINVGTKFDDLEIFIVSYPFYSLQCIPPLVTFNCRENVYSKELQFTFCSQNGIVYPFKVDTIDMNPMVTVSHSDGVIPASGDLIFKITFTPSDEIKDLSGTVLLGKIAITGEGIRQRVSSVELILPDSEISQKTKPVGFATNTSVKAALKSRGLTFHSNRSSDYLSGTQSLTSTPRSLSHSFSFSLSEDLSGFSSSFHSSRSGMFDFSGIASSSRSGTGRHSEKRKRSSKKDKSGSSHSHSHRRHRKKQSEDDDIGSLSLSQPTTLSTGLTSTQDTSISSTFDSSLSSSFLTSSQLTSSLALQSLSGTDGTFSSSNLQLSAFPSSSFGTSGTMTYSTTSSGRSRSKQDSSKLSSSTGKMETEGSFISTVDPSSITTSDQTPSYHSTGISTPHTSSKTSSFLSSLASSSDKHSSRHNTSLTTSSFKPSETPLTTDSSRSLSTTNMTSSGATSSFIPSVSSSQPHSSFSHTTQSDTSDVIAVALTQSDSEDSDDIADKLLQNAIAEIEADIPPDTEPPQVQLTPQERMNQNLASLPVKKVTFVETDNASVATIVSSSTIFTVSDTSFLSSSRHLSSMTSSFLSHPSHTNTNTNTISNTDHRLPRFSASTSDYSSSTSFISSSSESDSISQNNSNRVSTEPVVRQPGQRQSVLFQPSTVRILNLPSSLNVSQIKNRMRRYGLVQASFRLKSKPHTAVFHFLNEVMAVRMYGGQKQTYFGGIAIKIAVGDMPKKT